MSGMRRWVLYMFLSVFSSLEHMHARELDKQIDDACLDELINEWNKSTNVPI